MGRLTARTPQGTAYIKRLAGLSEDDQALEGSLVALNSVMEVIQELARIEDGKFEERATKAEAVCRIFHHQYLLSYTVYDVIHSPPPLKFEEWMDAQLANKGDTSRRR